MDIANFVDKQVHENFWEKDLNCSTNILMLLAEIKSIKLDKQVIHSVAGMDGLNPLKVPCGLLSGALMFLGIFGREKNIPNSQLSRHYYEYSKYFQRKFGDTSCKNLNSKKESLGLLPFSCENLTKDVVIFTIDFIDKHLKF